jgi:tRNA (guanine-N7-)-methyltransferase
VRRTARLPLEQLQPYLLEASPPARPRDGAAEPAPPPLHWPAVFGNERPVELEVGFGKGLFLLTASQRLPETNFVGIEIERKYVLFTASRVAKRGLANVRLACGDARAFLRDRVPAASLAAVHVYFPDPWWKTRHRQRRVFTEEFARRCEQILRPGGRLQVVTDVQDYFAVITELVARETRFRPLPPPGPHEPHHDLDYLTNFERTYRQQGRPIYRAAYELPELRESDVGGTP